MSTPPTSAAGAASMMRLPPSPETTKMRPEVGAMPDHLSLREHDAAALNNGSRLRSIARYGTFHPQAIACSTPLLTHYVHNDDTSQQKSVGDTVGKTDHRHSSPPQQQRGDTSIAAIAGPQGVALFRVSRPHTPLVVLSHASSRRSSAGAVSALSFQPHTKDSLLLAAARGNGILVWDATGHSLSPLLGRLAMEPTLSSSDRITSISWKASSSQSMLATTNATNACLWDLRTALRANSSRPSARLGSSRKINNNGTVIDPLVQIAASSKNEVATLDAAGTVYIFDIRMDRSPGNIGEVASFSAFHHVGIGLESLPSSNEDTRWVTWGLDEPQTDAVVKVWSDGAVIRRKDSDADSYWYMDSSPTTSPKTTMSKSVATKSVQMYYRQVAEFSTPFLACARVCPEPFEDRVVTVGMIPGRGGIGTAGWQAESWKLLERADDSYDDEEHHGVEKIASFKVLNDSEAASMVGTNATLGSLRGAELALEPPHGLHGFRQVEDKDEEEGADLLLLCLSDNGYVTTHTVFETAPPISESPKREMSDGGQDSPRHGTSQAGRPYAYSDGTRVFQADGRYGRDAASMLRVTGDSEQVGNMDVNDTPNQGSDEQLGKSVSTQQTDLQYFASGNLGSNDVPRPDDGASTQFVMDVPGVSGMDVVEVASPPIVLLANEGDAIEIGLQRQNVSATRIDKDKVPCPRLCGASFSPGIGGIVCFNNGEVRKMWSWFEQSDLRRGRIPMGEDRPASLDQSSTSGSNRRDDMYEGDSSVFNSESNELTAVRRRKDCPRTLQDLEDMTDHARFSQWRSDESSGGESSSDDESDESLDDFGLGDENGERDSEARKRMYEKYFGISQEKATSTSSPSRQRGEKGGTDGSLSPPRSPSSRQKQVSSSSKSNGGTPDNALFGPSSDLVPAVYITHDQDELVFSGQSEALACGWMLGEWHTVDDDEEMDGTSPRSLVERESTSSLSRDAFGWGWDEDALLQHSRSEYRLPLEKGVQLTGSDDRIQRVRSDPILLKASPARQQENKYGVGSDDDPVHAGAYSKRPNRNESLVFLKKLVTHQQGDKQIHSLMSPPDSPLLPNKMPLGRKKRSTSTGAIVQTPSPTSIVVDEDELGGTNQKAISLGVYTLSEERGPPCRAKLREEKLRDVCVHNAEVCIDLSQSEKANVWNLLSQMAENVLQDEHDNFNGWGGAYGGSLGNELVSSFLQFYESQGDVQMLATMVCVLGGGQRRKVAEGCSLLPVSHQDRYDSYIRRYADVLYAWRLMSKRAELRKHLSQRLPDPSDDDQYAAVDIIVWCSRCHKEAITDNGICRNCRSYAFCCSICDIAIRGLFTVCATCGHGGHTSHLAEWFNKHSMCPTGCGCECVSKMAMNMSNVPVLSIKPEQPLLDEVLQETPELLIAGAGQIPLEGYRGELV